MFRRMTRERFLSDAELARFMAAVRERRHLHQPRDHAFFALLANTGIRPSEARALRVCDIHIGARTRWIHVARPKRLHGAEATTDLEIPKPVAQVLHQYVSTLTSDPHRKLFPFTKRQSGRLFHYYGDKAGIDRSYRLYALRHSAGMRLWRHTRDLRLLQAIMGHVHLKATAAYVHVSPERISDAYQKLGTVA